jgi:hypothetical protein
MGWATLQTDLQTSLGTYAKGTRIRFWSLHGKHATICLDPINIRHPGRCHTYRLPLTKLKIEAPQWETTPNR